MKLFREMLVIATCLSVLGYIAYQLYYYEGVFDFYFTSSVDGEREYGVPTDHEGQLEIANSSLFSSRDLGDVIVAEAYVPGAYFYITIEQNAPLVSGGGYRQLTPFCEYTNIANLAVITSRGNGLIFPEILSINGYAFADTNAGPLLILAGVDEDSNNDGSYSCADGPKLFVVNLANDEVTAYEPEGFGQNSKVVLLNDNTLIVESKINKVAFEDLSHFTKINLETLEARPLNFDSFKNQ